MKIKSTAKEYTISYRTRVSVTPSLIKDLKKKFPTLSITKDDSRVLIVSGPTEDMKLFIDANYSLEDAGLFYKDLFPNVKQSKRVMGESLLNTAKQILENTVQDKASNPTIGVIHNDGALALSEASADKMIASLNWYIAESAKTYLDEDTREEYASKISLLESELNLRESYTADSYWLDGKKVMLKSANAKQLERIKKEIRKNLADIEARSKKSTPMYPTANIMPLALTQYKQLLANVEVAAGELVGRKNESVDEAANLRQVFHTGELAGFSHGEISTLIQQALKKHNNGDNARDELVSVFKMAKDTKKDISKFSRDYDSLSSVLHEDLLDESNAEIDDIMKMYQAIDDRLFWQSLKKDPSLYKKIKDFLSRIAKKKNESLELDEDANKDKEDLEAAKKDLANSKGAKMIKSPMNGVFGKDGGFSAKSNGATEIAVTTVRKSGSAWVKKTTFYSVDKNNDYKEWAFGVDTQGSTHVGGAKVPLEKIYDEVRSSFKKFDPKASTSLKEDTF